MILSEETKIVEREINCALCQDDVKERKWSRLVNWLF